MTGHHT